MSSSSRWSSRRALKHSPRGPAAPPRAARPPLEPAGPALRRNAPAAAPPLQPAGPARRRGSYRPDPGRSEGKLIDASERFYRARTAAAAGLPDRAA